MRMEQEEGARKVTENGWPKPTVSAYVTEPVNKRGTKTGRVRERWDKMRYRQLSKYLIRALCVRRRCCLRSWRVQPDSCTRRDLTRTGPKPTGRLQLCVRFYLFLSPMLTKVNANNTYPPAYLSHVRGSCKLQSPPHDRNWKSSFVSFRSFVSLILRIHSLTSNLAALLNFSFTSVSLLQNFFTCFAF